MSSQAISPVVEFFSAGHKENIETAVSLSKLGFLSFKDIQFYETGKNKAVMILAAGNSWFEHDHRGKCDA